MAQWGLIKCVKQNSEIHKSENKTTAEKMNIRLYFKWTFHYEDNFWLVVISAINCILKQNIIIEISCSPCKMTQIQKFFLLYVSLQLLTTNVFSMLLINITRNKIVQAGKTSKSEKTGGTLIPPANHNFSWMHCGKQSCSTK